MRETFSVGLSDLGDGLSWGEAKILIEEAANDPGTVFGAELADWAYPATTPMLISLMAQISDQKAAAAVMPWAMDSPRRRTSPTAVAEVAEATAQLEDSILFT